MRTALLNIVSGKLGPDSGTVMIDGGKVNRLTDYRRAGYVGRVFQDPMAGTAPSLTIEQNLAIAYQRGHRRGLSLAVTSVKREMFVRELHALELGLETQPG